MKAGIQTTGKPDLEKPAQARDIPEVVLGPSLNVSVSRSWYLRVEGERAAAYKLEMRFNETVLVAIWSMSHLFTPLGLQTPIVLHILAPDQMHFCFDSLRP